MKIVCVVDSIADFNEKINAIQNHFGNNILYVVKATLEPIFKTFNKPISAVYYKNLTTIIHTLLLQSEKEDVLIYYTSLKINEPLLNKFSAKIIDRSAVVSLMPRYNAFERINNSTYNVYVKSMFKVKDSMASPKLQFLPESCVNELLNSHIGNKLFELNPKLSKTVEIDNVEINKSAKVHAPMLKLSLISIIVALIITMFLIISLAFFSAKAGIIILFVCLYILDIVVTLIFQYKSYFDHRFLK